jgi:SAM-dependent methyltransferase
MQETVFGALPKTLDGTETYACPLCRGGALETIAEHNDRRLIKCCQCGVRFAFPRPAPAELTAHFERSQTLGEAELEAKFERCREQVLARLADYIQSRRAGGCILDVGCATGFFLARFFPKANWRVAGVELSSQTAAKAIGKEIRVYRGDIYTAQFAGHTFDVITVVDTFYYFLEPQFELAEFRRVLKPGGILVLELPLAGSRIWRTSHRLGKLLSGTRQQLLESSDHLFYYNPKSITLLLEGCGFRVRALLPLPGNKQEHVFRDLIYRAYSFLSLAVHSLSGSRVLLGPRFAVIACKK